MSGLFGKSTLCNFRKWWLVYAVILFLVYMAFFDKNNFIARVKYQNEIDFLKEQKKTYIERINRDSLIIEGMKHDVREIEKTAREKYGMKSPNEDIYIIIKENDGK